MTEQGITADKNEKSHGKPDEPHSTSTNSDTAMTTKDRITLAIAVFGATLSLINSFVTVSNYRSTARNAERTTRLESERDVDAAWDLLAGSEPGSGATRVNMTQSSSESGPA